MIFFVMGNTIETILGYLSSDTLGLTKVFAIMRERSRLELSVGLE